MKIAKVRRNNDGDITNIMTTEGEVMPVTKAICLANQGVVDSVVVGKNKNGNDMLVSTDKSKQEDRLENLPTF